MSVRAQVEARPGERQRVAAVLRWLEREGMLIVLVAAFALVLLARVRDALAPDGWMALLSGRLIVDHGLPSHDTLTVWSLGERWVDQQWLGQLALYGVDRAGGLAAVLLVNVALAVAGFAAALAVARSRGASARSVTWVGIVAVAAYYPGSSVMRTQSFAYMLFVALLWLLSSDARAPSRRVWLVLPLLALWGNVHGSVIFGAGLVSAYGITRLVESVVRDRGRTGLWRAVILAVAPWPFVLASPYGFELVGYYHKILFASGFGDLVSEWQPTTLTLVTVAFYVLVLAGMWLIGREGARLVPFEKVAFVFAAVLGLLAIRNIVWLALVALCFLPSAVEAVRRPSGPDPARMNRLLGIAALAAVVLTTAVIAGRSETWYLRDYPAAAGDAAAAAAGPHGRIFANEVFADWLIWNHPGLAGRVAFDSRFELRTRRQLESVAEFRSLAGNWHKTIRGYHVLVLDAGDERPVRRALVSEHRASVRYLDPHVAVLVTR